MMKCSCIKNYGYDAEVGYRDCRHLTYDDLSDWMNESGYTVPETYPVVIKIPSVGSQALVVVYTNKKNVLTTKELLGTKEKQCLPDDIYCFITESCGKKFTISRAVVCNCQTRVDVLAARAESQEEIERAKDFNSMLNAVKVAARIGKVQLASEMLTKLKKKLKHIDCDNCGCDEGKAW